MEKTEIIERNIISEASFIFSRSSGAGGQNVNKVNSKAELRFNIPKSEKLNNEEKFLILAKAKSYLNNENELIIISQESRSQFENKEICIEKFYRILEKCTKPTKKRIKTKRSAASIQKRLFEKACKSDTKKNRNQRIMPDE